MSFVSPNSTRISKRFAELRASGELGIVAYITAGDPTIDATLKFVLALAEAGADVVELGVPFSDPLADGPTIQRASERALKFGTTLAGVLDLVRRIRQTSQVPLVLFSYYNPILQMGLEKFASAAAAAGADGVLATDRHGTPRFAISHPSPFPKRSCPPRSFPPRGPNASGQGRPMNIHPIHPLRMFFFRLSTFDFQPLFRNGPRWRPFLCLSFRAQRAFCAPNVFSERGICFRFRSEAAS